MLEGIPVALITEWSVSGLLGLVVLFILLGKLVPRTTLQNQIAETTYWRNTAFQQEKTINVLANTVADLTESAKTQELVMKAIQEANKETE